MQIRDCEGASHPRNDNKIADCARAQYNNQVTFRYRDSNTGQPKLLSLDAFEFIHRFLQHVLPTGFVKVRYYGLFAPGYRSRLALVRQQLAPAKGEPAASPPPSTPTEPPVATGQASAAETESDTLAPHPSILIELEDENAPDAPDESSAPALPTSAPLCPACGQPMRRCASLPPKGRSPP